MTSSKYVVYCWRLSLQVFLLAALAGCSSSYYSAMEKFGIEKRDILVDRIDDTQEAQEDAKEQFVSALDKYRSVVNVDGGELETVYDQLNDEYERCETDAEKVRDRIDSVSSVAEDLFKEWEKEIGEFSNPSMARQSRSLLRETQAEYKTMFAAMKRAEESMEPVLVMFKDQVMFLRHNLNARAIGALKGELSNIEQATATLIADMERSINEASTFIDSMK